MDVAFNLRQRGQRHGLAAHDAGDLPTNEHVLAGDHTRHPAVFTDNDLRGLHVTVDLTVNLQHTTAGDFQALAKDPEIVANHGLAVAFRTAGAMLRALGTVRRNRARLERVGPGRRVTRKHEIPLLRRCLTTRSQPHCGMVELCQPRV